MSKPIVKYRNLRYCVVGKSALVETTNHPTTSNSKLSGTSHVVEYNPVTGHFATLNTRYAPGPFAEWPHGQDCAVKDLLPSRNFAG